MTAAERGAERKSEEASGWSSSVARGYDTHRTWRGTQRRGNLQRSMCKWERGMAGMPEEELGREEEDMTFRNGCSCRFWFRS